MLPEISKDEQATNYFEIDSEIDFDVFDVSASEIEVIYKNSGSTKNIPDS